MFRWFVKRVLCPQWVVVNDKDVGVKILGVVFGCYKAEPFFYDNKNNRYRSPEKRELGESL